MIDYIALKIELVNRAAMVSALGVGAFNFIAAEALTKNYAFAAVLSAISIPAAAYFAARPKTIAAKAAAEASRRTLAEGETHNLMERLTKIHEQHVAGLQEQVANLQARIDHADKAEKLIRISKHNALGALQAAYWHIDELRSKCPEAVRKASNTEFRKISVKEIFGEEDEQLALMIKKSNGHAT